MQGACQLDSHSKFTLQINNLRKLKNKANEGGGAFVKSSDTSPSRSRAACANAGEWLDAKPLAMQVDKRLQGPTQIRAFSSGADQRRASLANGRHIKYLTVADDFSHQCVEVAVDDCLLGQHATRLLDREAIFKGYPTAARTDNGPEYTCRALIARA